MSPEKHLSEPNPACAEIGEQLSAYLDGELTDAEREAVEAHLRGCPDCARLCAALRTLRADIVGAQLDPPPALHARVMAQVRRESRLRRMHRFTVAASAGVAAMFCFVVIGGAMMRAGADNAAAEFAPKMLMADAADGAGELGDAATTGAAFDATLEMAPIVAQTGISAGTGAEAEKSFTYSLTDAASPAETAAETCVPENNPCGVIAVTLPDTMRILSRLDYSGEIAGLSTARAETGNTPAEKVDDMSPNTLGALFSVRDARLAAEQVGTLCVVELGDEYETPVYLVYDLITEQRLSLGDFLGTPDALTALGLEADAAYRPTGAGLLILGETGEKLLPWDSHDALIACVTRYDMTRQPLCGAAE